MTSTTIDVPQSRAKLRIDQPQTPTDTVVVFLPGLGGGALTDRFDDLSSSVTNIGKAIARVSLWEGGQDLAQETFTSLHNELHTVIQFLASQGFQKILGIGKSFGGALMLTYPHTDMGARIGWAPALFVGTSTTKDLFTFPIGKRQSLQEINLEESFFKHISYPLHLIHGTNDSVIPFSNSEKISTLVPNTSLVAIKGADHAFRNSAHEQQLISAVKNFLK